MTDAPLILSASSISAYLRCGHAWLMGNIWRVPAAPNMAMAVGTAVHAGVEQFWKGLPDPVGTTQGAFRRELESMPTFDKREGEQGIVDAHNMLKVYFEKIAPTFRPTIVEKAFVMDIQGILVSGQIDAADEDVHDTKTTATLSKFRPERHRLQMTIYKLGYAVLTGRAPRRLLLDVIARNGRWKTVEIEPDVNEFMGVLGLVQTGIMRGEFPPNGALNGSCARCPYLEICDYARPD